MRQQAATGATCRAAAEHCSRAALLMDRIRFPRGPARPPPPRRRRTRSAIRDTADRAPPPLPHCSSAARRRRKE